jgi:hypothetical protein
MLTNSHAGSDTLLDGDGEPYADVCWRMLTNADAGSDTLLDGDGEPATSLC